MTEGERYPETWKTNIFVLLKLENVILILFKRLESGMQMKLLSEQIELLGYPTNV